MPTQYILAAVILAVTVLYVFIAILVVRGLRWISRKFVQFQARKLGADEKYDTIFSEWIKARDEGTRIRSEREKLNKKDPQEYATAWLTKYKEDHPHKD